MKHLTSNTIKFRISTKSFSNFIVIYSRNNRYNKSKFHNIHKFATYKNIKFIMKSIVLKLKFSSYEYLKALFS